MIATCFFTDEVSDNIDDACARGAAAGAQTVELRSRLYGKGIHELTRAELAALRGTLARNGLTTACIASSFGKCDLESDDEWRQHQSILRGSIASAQALGTDLVRVFPFWTPDRQDHPRPRLGDLLGRVADRLAWAVRHAEAEGVVLCFETEPATLSGTAAETRAIIDALLPSPALAVAWDPVNALDADGELPLEEGYARIRGLVRHVHVKPNRAGDIETVGDSGVSYRELFARLLADGYSGAASIEHWGSPEAMIEGVRQLRRLLATVS